MHRARPVASFTALIAVAFLAAGCGGMDNGPAGPGGTGFAPTRASDEIAPGNALDRAFGTYTASGVSRDGSISDPLKAGYGSVPGADMLDPGSTLSLDYDSDPMSSTSVSNLSMDDPSLASMSYGDGVDLDSGPLGLAGGATFDAAMTDAESTYGGMAGDVDTLDDIGLDDPMSEGGDPLLEAELDTPPMDEPLW